jgi:hypothetical protein
VLKLQLTELAGENVCKARVTAEGTVEYYCDSLLFRNDKFTGPGQQLYEKALKHMKL